MPLTLRPHHYERIPGTSEVRLVRLAPYVRLKVGDGPAVFVQDGQVFSEGGPRVEPPAWFWDEARKLTPAVRAEVGLQLPEERRPVDAVAEAEVAPAVELWTCPNCSKQIKARGKHLHLGRCK